MKQETENRQQRPQMICLCATCANAFYNVPTIRIQRVDRYQLVKDTCTYCGVRNGYDYIIRINRITISAGASGLLLSFCSAAVSCIMPQKASFSKTFCHKLPDST